MHPVSQRPVGRGEPQIAGSSRRSMLVQGGRSLVRNLCHLTKSTPLRFPAHPGCGTLSHAPLYRSGPWNDATIRRLTTTAEPTLSSFLNPIHSMERDCEDSLQIIKKTSDMLYASRLQEIQEELERAPDLWERQPERAGKLDRERRKLESKLSEIQAQEQSFRDVMEMIALAEVEGDVQVLSECKDELESIKDSLREAELHALMRGPMDNVGSCYVEVSSGAGGTEAMDFCEMLFNMYKNWGENHGMTVQVKEVSHGAEAGLRSGVATISGDRVYGYLRHEVGPHRIMRYSPYCKEGRRHTSFAMVAVYPIAEGEEDAGDDSIPESELRYDTFRSSGPGGQSVNKTESAVRVTHIPTGLAVSSQSERSQHRNKAMAISLLKAKLLHIKLKAKAKEAKALKDDLGDASFGSGQVRSYSINPHKYAKDHRSNHEESDVMGLLEGGPALDRMLESVLRSMAGEEEKP